MLFILGLLALLVVADAYRPIFKAPLSVVAFFVGWLPAELPFHGIVLSGVIVALCVAAGALHSWLGIVGAVAFALAGLGLLGLCVSTLGAARLVDEALEQAAGGPLRAPNGVDLRPVWVRGWRLILAVPFRFRSVRRIKNIDYWGDGIHRHRLDVLVRRNDPPKVVPVESDANAAGTAPSDSPEKGAPVLVYVHGGAWIMGEKREQGIPMMHELARRGWVCVAINYRLSPKYSWPDHIVDVKRALAYVRSHIAEYGGDPNFIAISGGSAGGHLSALAAVTSDDSSWQPGFEDADTSVAACVPFYGVHDVTGDPEASGRYDQGLVDLLGERVMKVTVADDPERYAQASPDQRITPSAPPMLVFQGVNDTLVPVEVARRFVERLRTISTQPVAYVELPLTQHAFDILFSVRCRSTTLGVVRFLEAIRAQKATPITPPGVVDSQSGS